MRNVTAQDPLKYGATIPIILHMGRRPKTDSVIRFLEESPVFRQDP